MSVWGVLSDPVRRRVLELLVDGERPAGAITDLVAEEFGITQPATSRHLRVLREAGLVAARVDGSRRLYALAPEGLRPVQDWLERLSGAWAPALMALETEVARGRRATATSEKTTTTTEESAEPA